MDLVKMWTELKAWINYINDDKMKKDLSKYMELHKGKFMVTPGSIKHHHSYEGGLLKHTLEVIKIATGITFHLFHQHDDVFEDFTKFVDKVVFVAVIHDVAKTFEYEFKIDRWVYMDAGMGVPTRIFHSEFPINDWLKTMEYDLSDDIKEAILTHHGGWAPSRQKLQGLLSAVIHSADLISSRFERS